MKQFSTAAVVFTLAAAQIAVTQTAQADMTARRASDFVDSVGVSTQFWVNSAAYYYAQNPALVLQKMKALNMRYYRGYWQNSYRDYGMKGMAFIDTRNGSGVLDANGITNSLNRYNGYESELIAVEGPNEYDFSTPGSDAWISPLRSYMQSLRNTVRSRSAYNNIPLLGPSMAAPDNWAKLGNIADRSDIANAHAYSGEKEPESWWYEDQSQGYMIDAWKTRATSSHPGQPMWVTETGYNNISDDAKAKFVPRHYLWFFMRGVPRTMTFEMIASESNHDWGLLRNDLSEKPAYTSLKNFMSVINDTNSTFTPGTLQYSISGDLTNVKQFLLQKGDGSYYLMLWQSARSWEPSGDKSIPNRNLTLNLTTSVGTVNTYLPKNGAGVVNTYNSPTSINLSVPDHVLIVELKPAGAQSGLPNGTYKIVNKNSGKALTVSGNSTSNGANIVQWTYTGASSQHWTFTSLGGGYYSIKNANSNLFMDISGQSLSDGAANIQWAWNGGNNQQWSLSPAGSGYYNIVNRNSGKVLDITGASTADGAQDIQWFFNNGDNQRWAISAVSGGGSTAPIGRRVAFRAKANNKIVCADNYGASPLIASRTSVGAWESFDVFDGGNGTIGLKAVANGKFVAATNNGNSPLQAAYQTSLIGPSEQFYWITNSDGTISLRAAINNKIVCTPNYGSDPLIANRDSIGDWEKFNFSAQ